MADQLFEWLLSRRKAARVFALELFAKRGITHFKRILSYDNFTMNTSRTGKKAPMFQKMMAIVLDVNLIGY